MIQRHAAPLINRTSIIFLTGLLAAAMFTLSLEKGAGLLIMRGDDFHTEFDAPSREPVPPSALSEVDREAAEIAWAYFENNTQIATGLVDSTANFPSTTLWDQAGYIFAFIAAKRLGLIDDEEFEFRAGGLLNSIAKFELYNDALPNKVYNTKTLRMTDYGNNEMAEGIGFSALDLGRFLMALRALELEAPLFGPQVRLIVNAWTPTEMSYEGELFGTTVFEDGPVHGQEGRIGYEQYAARAAALWGLDVNQAISARRVLNWETIHGVRVPIDLRLSSIFKSITPTLSEPYILEGLEMGFNHESQLLASRVYEVQEARFIETGLPTMVSEDHISVAPYFLYSSIHSNGIPWAVVAETGERFDELRTLSTKAVFGWDALYQTEYTTQLREDIRELGVLNSGWYAGRYEQTGELNDTLTLNTNAVILEALHYRAFGPFLTIESVIESDLTQEEQKEANKQKALFRFNNN